MTSACENRPTTIDFEIYATEIQIAPAEPKLKLIARPINQVALQAHQVVASILDQQTNFVYTQGFKTELKSLGWKMANLVPLEQHLGRELQLCIQTPDRLVKQYLKGQIHKLTVSYAS